MRKIFTFRARHPQRKQTHHTCTVLYRSSSGLHGHLHDSVGILNMHNEHWVIECTGLIRFSGSPVVDSSVGIQYDLYTLGIYLQDRRRRLCWGTSLEIGTSGLRGCPTGCFRRSTDLVFFDITPKDITSKMWHRTRWLLYDSMDLSLISCAFCICVTNWFWILKMYFLVYRF